MKAKRAVVTKTKKAAVSGPKLRARRLQVEKPFASAEAAKAWERWTKRGPQGPIEDDSEFPS